MHASRVPISAAGLAAMSDIAAVATSAATVDERTAEVIERLRSLIPIAAAAASVIEPLGGGRRRMLVNTGYSERLVEHLTSEAYDTEVVEPHVLPERGWPVRERDLAVEPLSLTSVAEFYRPEGLTEGLVSALVTRDGRYVGLLDISVAQAGHPNDEACGVVGHLAPMLAELTDPLQSARTMAAALAPDCTAVALMPGGEVVPLAGDPDAELLSPAAPMLEEALELMAAGRAAAAFLWPRRDGRWHGCRVLRCRDGVAALMVRDDPDLRGLTLRELEVLACLADGLSNEEIGRRLFIAHRTARTHVEHVFAKLGVRTRAAAVTRATQDGLLLPARAVEALR